MKTILLFWTWYFDLYSNPDDKIRIATWAATVATLTFIIAYIFKPLRNYLGNVFSKSIRIKAGISHQLITSAFGTNAGVPLLTCTVTNHSSATVYIQSPKIILSQPVNGDKMFSVAPQGGRFPMRLDPGAQQTFDYSTVTLYNQLLQHIKPTAKVGFMISSTTGKKCYSNRFTKKHITGHIEVANRI